MKHTPGPWFVSPDNGMEVLHAEPDGRERLVARCAMRDLRSGCGGKDDAQLIAAAPELLEKANTLVLMHVAEQEGLCPPTPRQWMDAVDAMHAAIAKARGEK